MGVMTPVATKNMTGKSAKQVTPTCQGPEPKQSHLSGQELGLEVIDTLLEISSRLQATEAYIASQQKTESVNCTGVATQPTGAKGSRRGSNLPATSPTQDAATDISEVVQEKAPILDMTTTEEGFMSKPESLS